MGHKKRRRAQLASQPITQTTTIKPQQQAAIPVPSEPVSRRFKTLCLVGIILLTFSLALTYYFRAGERGDFWGATVLDVSGYEIAFQTDYYPKPWTVHFKHDISQYFEVGQHYDFQMTKRWDGYHLIEVNHTLPYTEPPK